MAQNCSLFEALDSEMYVSRYIPPNMLVRKDSDKQVNLNAAAADPVDLTAFGSMNNLETARNWNFLLRPPRFSVKDAWGRLFSHPVNITPGVNVLYGDGHTKLSRWRDLQVRLYTPGVWPQWIYW